MVKTFVISLFWQFDLVSVHMMMASNLNGLGCISPEFMEPMKITLKYCWPFISSAIYANRLHAYLGTSLLRMAFLVAMHKFECLNWKSFSYTKRLLARVRYAKAHGNFGHIWMKFNVSPPQYELHVHILISSIQMVWSRNISTPIIFHANHKDIDKMGNDKINCSTFVCRNLMWWAA